MWAIPTLGVDTTHKIFVSVKNAASVKMTVGHGVYWHYTVTNAGALGTGYEVTFSPVATTNAIQPALLCGVVGRRAINIGEYGFVQKYGQIDALAVTGGASAAPYVSQVVSYSTHTANKFTNLVLRPANAAFTTPGAVANYGYFGYMKCLSQVTTQVQTTASDVGFAWPGGYALPLGNVPTTATYTGGTTVKAFLKMLG